MEYLYKIYILYIRIIVFPLLNTKIAIVIIIEIYCIKRNL